MESNNLSLHASHQKTWILLPWYVNCALTGNELEQVREHLKMCVTCRRELISQRRLVRMIRETDDREVCSQSAFLRLKQRIDEETGRQQHIRPRPVTHSSKLQNLWYRLGTVLSSPRPVATALSLLFILALPVGIWLTQSKDPEFHTLAKLDSLPIAGKNDIRVVFAKTTPEAEKQRLIASIHGQILNGPSPAGVYTIRIATPDMNSPSIEAIVRQLRQNTQIIFAEPALASNGDRQPHKTK